MHPADLQWIKDRMPAMDQALAGAARAHFEQRRGRAESNLRYDIQQALRESYNLGSGHDLCYDRPSTPFVYALWYHARRVNTCLGLLGRALEKTGAPHLTVYDLGAGTGAWQWALALTTAAMTARGLKPPTLHLVNVDTSPFMLGYLDALWRALCEGVPECAGLRYTCDLESWVNEGKRAGHAWVCASYLFDHSDKEEPLRERFERLVEAYQPEHIFLSTAQGKGAFLRRVTRSLEGSDYTVSRVPSMPPLTGSLDRTTRYRRELDRRHGLRLNATRPTRWDEISFSGTCLIQTKPELALGQAGNPLGRRRINLFIPPVKDRKTIRLTAAQRQAAEHKPRPAHVYGPAGCGKTVVLTERIKNLVVTENYSPNLRILITTFNKELLYLLRAWLKAVLDAKKVTWVISMNGLEENPVAHAFFEGSSRNNLNLSLMHFDVLPTRIGKIDGVVEHDAYHHRKATEAVEATTQFVQAADLPVDRYGHVLDPEAVLEEFHRVYYGRWERGQERWTEAQYLDCQRPPGRLTLQRQKRPRQIMWSCLNRYLHLCRAEQVASFTMRRLKLLLELQQGFHNGLFTHVFVDEYQDCTPADFDIFYYLLQEPDHIVVGGDLAQALHVGRSASSPRRAVHRWSSEQRYFEHLHLDGSFRLPFRISEAIAPFSGSIKEKWTRATGDDAEEVDVQIPFKGSPPGARPIVVWAATSKEMAAKLCAVYDTYEGYGLDQMTVLDKDVDLRVALRRAGRDNAETDTVFRIKGLEKTFVVWSTRAAPGGRDEVEEHVYTILTRTSRLLVVALFDEVLEIYRPILDALDRSRLIFWDAETERRFPVLSRVQPMPV